MAGDDQVKEAPETDGLTAEEQAQFAEMEKATSGDAPIIENADSNDGAVGDGAAGGDAAAGAADGAADAAATRVAGEGGAAKDGAVADAGDDDDDEPGAPELGKDGKPVLEADGRPRRKARVSAKKYQTEKERADKLDADLRSERDIRARTDERLKIINEALTRPRAADEAAVDDDPAPDKEADVFGYIEWQDRQRSKLEKRLNDLQSGQQTQTTERQVAETYVDDARQFAAKEPNFVPAYTYLMQTRMQQLALYHFGVDLTAEGATLDADQAARIKRDIAEEERGIATTALRQRKSPAQIIFQMAKATGYRPAAAAAANGAGGGANGAAAGAEPGANGKPGAGAAQNGGKPASVSDEIERIKAGSEAALSLSDGGSSPGNPLTAERLANMPQDEFDRLMDRLDPDEVRVLFEGRA